MEGDRRRRGGKEERREGREERRERGEKGERREGREEGRERGKEEEEEDGHGASHSLPLFASIPTSLYFCRYSRRGSM